MEGKKELRVVGIIHSRVIGSNEEFTVKKSSFLPKAGETIKLERVDSDGIYYIGRVVKVDGGRNTYVVKFMSEHEEIRTG